MQKILIIILKTFKINDCKCFSLPSLSTVLILDFLHSLLHLFFLLYFFLFLSYSLSLFPLLFLYFPISLSFIYSVLSFFSIYLFFFFLSPSFISFHLPRKPNLVKIPFKLVFSHETNQIQLILYKLLRLRK